MPEELKGQDNNHSNPTCLDLFVTFFLGEQRLALPIKSVVKALPACHITAMPGAPKYVIGLVNYRGDILTIVDLRIKFGYPLEPMQLSDQFLLINTKTRSIALLTQGNVNVQSISPTTINSSTTKGNNELTFRGVYPQQDGIILIHDLANLFSEDEDALLSNLLKHHE